MKKKVFRNMYVGTYFFNKKVNDPKILNKLQTTILLYYSIKRQVFHL